jgi:transposase-like protein
MSNGQKGASSVSAAPDPEVTPKAKRRSFSAVYKKKVLAEVDAAAGTGQIGAILRREGIYSSTLTGWRREREAAVHNAFSQKRGPEPKQNPLAAENENLRRQNQRLTEELRKAEIIIDVQKKVALLLGRPLAPVPGSGNS